MKKRTSLYFLGLLTVFSLLLGCQKDYFLTEYPELTDKEHIFVEVTFDKIVEAVDKKEHFILYFGFPSCPWCQAFTPVLNRSAKNLYKTKIWYYNPKEGRKELTEEYLTLLDIIGLERPTTKEEQVVGVNRISVPFISLVNDGKIEDNYMWDDSLVPVNKLKDEATLLELEDFLTNDFLPKSKCDICSLD